MELYDLVELHTALAEYSQAFLQIAVHTQPRGSTLELLDSEYRFPNILSSPPSPF